jgi:hypothetical protein
MNSVELPAAVSWTEYLQHPGFIHDLQVWRLACYPPCPRESGMPSCMCATTRRCMEGASRSTSYIRFRSNLGQYR